MANKLLRDLGRNQKRSRLTGNCSVLLHCGIFYCTKLLGEVKTPRVCIAYADMIIHKKTTFDKLGEGRVYALYRENKTGALTQTFTFDKKLNLGIVLDANYSWKSYVEC